MFKSSCKTDVSDYCLISLLCASSKIFQLALLNILYVSGYNSLVPNKHVFLSGRSTTTNVASFMTQISSPISLRGEVDVIYCDMSKAFDVVGHPLINLEILMLTCLL